MWWFQWAGPSASIVNGFALASAFVPVQALRTGAENVAFSEPSSSKQRPGPSSLESVAIQPASCHNNGFNSDAGKLSGGKAGRARWRRRLTQTLGFKMSIVKLHAESIAELQLLAAIELADHGNWVPAITLAGAAEEILGKRLRRLGKTPSFDSMKAAVMEIAAKAGANEPGLDRDIGHLINLTKNELKHYSGSEAIEFDLERDGVELLERAIANYEMLTGTVLPEMLQFWSQHSET